jgi:hypothetical protein
MRATAYRIPPPQKSNEAKSCPAGRIGNTLLAATGQVPASASPFREAETAICEGWFHE